MFILVYTIDPSKTEEELLWLRELKLYASTEETLIWPDMKKKVRIGLIADEGATLTIKLRHKLDVQEKYN